MLPAYIHYERIYKHTMSNHGPIQPCLEDQLRQAANILNVSVDRLAKRLEAKDSVRASFASSSGGPSQDQHLSHGAVRRQHQADRGSAVTFNDRDFDTYSIPTPRPEPFVNYEHLGTGYHEQHCHNAPPQAHQSFTNGPDVDALGMPVPGFLGGPAVTLNYQSHSNISVACLSGISRLPNLAPREPRQTKRKRETDVDDQDRSPRGRGSFRDQQTRESTALTGVPQRCIRCRMQRSRVRFFRYVHLDLSMTFFPYSATHNQTISMGHVYNVNILDDGQYYACPACDIRSQMRRCIESNLLHSNCSAKGGGTWILSISQIGARRK